MQRVGARDRGVVQGREEQALSCGRGLKLLRIQKQIVDGSLSRMRFQASSARL
jgi:hypothetical protein